MNKTNIVMVIFDTLRWDYFQKLIETDQSFKTQLSDFVNFNMAFSPSPWTLPSHFSLFTGLYPSEHGVHETEQSDMEEIFQKARNYSGEFITKVASLNGYKTIGISANPMISYLTGIEEKFDTFYNIDLGASPNSKTLKSKSYNTSKIQDVKSRVILNLRGYPKNKGYKLILSLFNKSIKTDPFFIFINFMEMHDPYRRTIWVNDNYAILKDIFHVKPLKSKYVNKLRNQYYNQVEKVKDSILQLMIYLKMEKKIRRFYINFYG